jgi:hypothetical protein
LGRLLLSAAGGEGEQEEEEGKRAHLGPIAGRAANIFPILLNGEGTRQSLVEGYLTRVQRFMSETAKACAKYPSTTLRVVPLPIFDGEDYQAVRRLWVPWMRSVARSKLIGRPKR